MTSEWGPGWEWYTRRMQEQIPGFEAQVGQPGQANENNLVSMARDAAQQTRQASLDQKTSRQLDQLNYDLTTALNHLESGDIQTGMRLVEEVRDALYRLLP